MTADPNPPTQPVTHPGTAPLTHTINVTAPISPSQIGDFWYGGFVICRGCGGPVVPFHQPSMQAHLNACAPLRSLR